MKKLAMYTSLILGGIALVAGLSFFFALPFKWCWNYAVTAIFELPRITWGQAWCLLFVASSLFKSTTISSSTK